MTFFALLSALGAFFGFANPLWRAPALVALFPMGLCLIAREAATPKQAFKIGWLAGALGYAASLYWIALPVWQYGGLPLALAIPCPILVGMYLGLYPGLFAMLLSYARPRLGWGLLALFAGCLWASLETARGLFLTGFPWLVLPSALAPWPWAIQAASVVGAEGLGGLLAAAAALFSLGNGFSRQRLSGLLLLGSIALFGLWRLDQPLPETRTFSAALVQGNVDQAVKWDKSYQDSTVETYLALSENEMRRHKPDLVVWPETAMPFYFQDDSPDSLRVREFAARSEARILTGAPGYDLDPATERYRFYNRAYLLGGGGKTLAHYDKAHLVPFGEYVPLQQVLFFIPKLVQAAGDFYAGQDPGPLVAGDVAMGVLICYETIFPELAQERVEAGANTLVNISNDAWFGRSSAPLQHLDMSALRAVEQGRWLLRATNTGVSAVIDPKGRIATRTGLFETASLFMDRIGLASEKTPYHRAYGLLRAGVPVVALLLLLKAALSIPRRKPV